MSTKVLPGGITDGIRHIEEGDYPPTITVGKRPKLCVVEHGDVRCLPISRQVAEILIANGMACGN